jgi:hypothetical protein
MKISPIRQWKSGYVSTLLVLSTGSLLTLLTIYAYRKSTLTMETQAKVQLRVDYSEKEEAILRSIVAITPNRAMRSMFSGSNANSAASEPLRWQNIFNEALILANARTSISPELVTSLDVTGLNTGNAGDSTLTDPSRIFAAIPNETGYVSPGINRSLGTGYPVPLTSGDSTTSSRDALYPIISANKVYGTLAQSGVGLPVATYPNFNLLKYPQINFGYAKPGENFVAKRNWWAFSVDVADHDDNLTFLARSKRNFVLSIYEIPSQLAISASSFMSLGQFASGSAWQNVTIAGGIFAGKAEVLGNTAFNSLASRRGMTLSSGTTLGGQSFTESPFKAGVRESYQVTTGQFFPASLASESGRVAFVPINRGAEFFDRFAHSSESNVLSSTSWNNYSVGALQCAMRLDVTGVQSSTDPTPTMLRFSYFLSSGNRATMNMPLTSAVQTTLPPGYVKICNENQSYTFSSTVPVDVAYGKPGGYTFRQGVTGTITFNNATFGDPLVEVVKEGYWRPRSPFEIKSLASGQRCVSVYPERIPSFLTTIGAAPATSTISSVMNNSLVVNVDYSTTGLNDATNYKPRIPCTGNDYGVILKECGNLSSFGKGFSLVTNLRLYIGDDFNTTAGTPPTGYTPTGTYYPPCSLFAPEKRYGADVDPFAIVLAGQVGSLASESATTAVRPLDSKNVSGNAIAPGSLTINLRPITHPADLPPITMMNWLLVLEERRKEFY